MVLLAALDVVFARRTGNPDVAVGAPVAGRGRPGLDDLVGCFLNLVVLRTGLAGDPRFNELVGRVRDTCLAAYDHAEVPLEKVHTGAVPPWTSCSTWSMCRRPSWRCPGSMCGSSSRRTSARSST
jgi:hypothetical protein